MNKKLSLALRLLVTIMGAAMLTTIMTVKPILAISPVPCQNCSASSLSPGDAKNFAPGNESKIPVPGYTKNFSPGNESKIPGVGGQ